MRYTFTVPRRAYTAALTTVSVTLRIPMDEAKAIISRDWLEDNTAAEGAALQYLIHLGADVRESA